jgi:uncharacterized membrane protein
MMLLWLIPIGILTYYLWQPNGPQRWNPPSTRTPEDRLKQRLANGEITIPEYRDILQTLEEDE